MLKTKKENTNTRFLSFKKSASLCLLILTSLCANAQSHSSLTVEELRIDKVSQAIPSVVSQLDPTVNSFNKALSAFENAHLLSKVELQSTTNKDFSNEIKAFIKKQGQQLWQNATGSFHHKQNLDDRPLYWARLKISKALRQSKLFASLSPIQQAETLWALELSSRGQSDISFDKKTDHKILLLGFDPFLLDRNIEQNNPSGVTALSFDNKIINYQGKTVEVETFIAPVRFADFDQGMIETVLTPYMKDIKVDMILTVSMGRESFDLERFPGLRRSVTAPDNLNIKTGANPQNPLIPMLKDKPLDGTEFLEFSLPVEQMVKAKGAFKVFDNRNVTIAASSLASLLNNDTGNTPTAVQGAGGGYLSNEISYRSLRLRNLYRPNLPVGHIHTPRVSKLDIAEHKNIIDQIQSMIELSLSTLK
jgi:pyrrolidone-carboxylate peptidase